MLRRFTASAVPTSMMQRRFAAVGAGTASSVSGNSMNWKTATPEGSTRNDNALDDIIKVAFIVGTAWWFTCGPGYYDTAPYHK